MNIRSLNIGLNNSIGSNKNQSFNGLWGGTTRLVDKDPVLGVNTDYETYYYYPYLDEPLSEIDNVIKNNTAAYIDAENGSRYVVKECKVCTTLPFKAVHFDIYRHADSSTRLTQNLKKVHFSVQDKYINNQGEQKSAVNDVIKSRLNVKM